MTVPHEIALAIGAYIFGFVCGGIFMAMMLGK
jgi:hypothetical protein